MVTKLSQKAKEQRSQLSSLLVGQKFEPFFSYQTKRERLIEIAPHEYISSPSLIKRKTLDRDTDEDEYEGENSSVYLKEFITPRADNNHFKRKAGPPPLMNLNQDLKQALQRRRNLLQKRLNHKDLDAFVYQKDQTKLMPKS
jgi:hypothetical protein